MGVWLEFLTAPNGPASYRLKVSSHSLAVGQVATVLQTGISTFTFFPFSERVYGLGLGWAGAHCVRYTGTAYISLSLSSSSASIKLSCSFSKSIPACSVQAGCN